MDYFCYVSRNKIDQLFQSLSTEQIDEWVERKTTENGLSTSAKADWSIANIIDLFKGEITYGRKGVIQHERTVKKHYVEKLRTVLLAITKEHYVPSLQRAVQHSNLNSMYYHHKGQFKVETPITRSNDVDSTTVITVSTEVLSKKLLLDCSLRFFSEGNQPDGKFAIHSGNHRFFSGRINLWFETIFMLLDQQDEQLIGTPLFLKLLATRNPKSRIPTLL